MTGITSEGVDPAECGEEFARGRDDEVLIDIWRNLVRGVRSVTVRIEREQRCAYGITVPQFIALNEIFGTPDRRVRVAQLSELLVYSSGATTKLVDQLSRAGLITRERSEADSRVNWVVLTQAGLSLTEQARELHRRIALPIIGDAVGRDRPELIHEFAQRLAVGLPPDGD
ncbi:MarR family winged helix-turn-helix transcriptional regulator [Mycobacteroides chelonae]|uniref:MarR family winged helix-turn-helix transcriptional regulator n=1 Tax=Mycobacteroides chelonae TaxID=1774 RepID=UPI003AAA2DDC